MGIDHFVENHIVENHVVDEVIDDLVEILALLG